MKTTLMTMALGVCLTGFAGENLLKNGDFESGNSGGWGSWTSETKTKVVSEGAHGGLRCLSYTHTGAAGCAFLVNNVPVDSNGTYTVSGWIKGDAGSLGIRLFFNAPGGKYLCEQQAYVATCLGDWTHFEKVFKVPAAAASVGVGLEVSRGTAYLDDVRVEAGNQVGEAPNEIVNSAYTYMLHEDGMPEQWNTYSGHGFDTFRPGVHEGKYYRMANEVKSPVEGARVVFAEGVYATSVRMGPLAGDQDYVFSVWAKSDAPNAKLELRFAGKAESFALSNAWRRLVMKARLAKSQSEGSALIVYDRHPVFYAAPMLHAGTEPLPWKPSPSDANLPDLRAGKQVVVPQAESLAFDVPETADWSGAKRIDDFYPLADLATKVSAKYRAFVRRQGGALLVAIECDSGKKPAVAPQEHNPLVIGNDAAELFVSSSASGSPFVQFMGGRNGASAATLGSQGVAVNEGWKYRASETEKGWRAEYELPLSFFDKPDGDVWRLNVGITDFDGAKPRYYSAIPAGFHVTRAFMRLSGMPRGTKTLPVRVAAEFDFYTDEKTARVKIEDAEGGATVTLRGLDGLEVNRSAVQPPTSDLQPSQAEFDLSGLAEGYYEIEAKAANGTAKTHFRKAAAGTRYTRINRFKHQIEADGKPFFPMVYSWMNLKGELPTAWHVDQLKSHNFNTVMLTPEMWADWVRAATPENRLKTMRAFADAGFKFIIWSGPGKDWEKNRIMGLVEARKRHIAEFEAFKQDILGWYYVDEIGSMWETMFNVKLEDYAKGYRAMKDYDPARLHFINWGWTNIADGMPFYAEEGATDLYSLDCYPYTQVHYGYGALQIHEQAARILNGRIRATAMPGIMWLQTYGTNEGFREPMPVEYRNNVYVGLVNHVVGYMSFVGCPEHKDLWDEMGRNYGTALKWLEMTAQPGAECLHRGRQGNVVYALWKDGCGGYALVAANLVYAAQRECMARGVRTANRELRIATIGGEGELKIGTDGALDISLPSAGSAAWFMK